MIPSIADLNRTFGLDGKIRFTEESGLVKLSAESAVSRLECFLHGAHITSFRPSESGEVLWLSPMAVFKEGTAIRGGIPICWPWFGKPLENTSLQQHGFARNSVFEVVETSHKDDGELQIRLSLSASDASLKLWPYQFRLDVCIRVGAGLSLELITHNLDSREFSITEAIHSYFKVDDISGVEVQGLQGAQYYDQLLDEELIQSETSCTVIAETDRIYQAPAQSLSIFQNRTNNRPTIKLEQQRGNAVVVWNPWIEKSRSMQDFPDNGYREMLCVESANAHFGSVTLAPGKKHSLRQKISLSP